MVKIFLVVMLAHSIGWLVVMAAIAVGNAYL